jgi:hypothetical protein
MLLGHHIGGERLGGGIGEGASTADRQQAGVDQQHIRGPRHHEDQQAKGAQRATGEADRDDAAAIVGVGEMARKERQQGGWQKRCEARNAQRQRAARHPINIPAHRHGLHGQGHAKQQSRGAMKAEIAMGEGCVA